MLRRRRWKQHARDPRRDRTQPIASPSLQHAHLQVAHAPVNGDADIMGVASQCEVYAGIADAKVFDADLLQRGGKHRRGQLDPFLLSVNG